MFTSPRTPGLAWGAAASCTGCCTTRRPPPPGTRRSASPPRRGYSTPEEPTPMPAQLGNKHRGGVGGGKDRWVLEDKAQICTQKQGSSQLTIVTLILTKGPALGEPNVPSFSSHNRQHIYIWTADVGKLSHERNVEAIELDGTATPFDPGPR